MRAKLYVSTFLLASFCINLSEACRFGPERTMKITKALKQLLDTNQLASIFWDREPFFKLPHLALTSIDVYSIESHFDESLLKSAGEEFVKDVMISCELDALHKSTMIASIDIVNPFRRMIFKANITPSTTNTTSKITFGIDIAPFTLIQLTLSQPINGESCLQVQEVHLEDKFDYKIDCFNCSEDEVKTLEPLLNRRTVRLITSIQQIIDEKIKLGLLKILGEVRVDFDKILLT